MDTGAYGIMYERSAGEYLPVLDTITLSKEGYIYLSHAGGTSYVHPVFRAADGTETVGSALSYGQTGLVTGTDGKAKLFPAGTYEVTARYIAPAGSRDRCIAQFGYLALTKAE